MLPSSGMATPWRALALSLAASLAAVAATWYWTTHTASERPFESCHFEGNVLVLKWTAGVNERNSVQLDTRNNALVVSLRTEVGRGDSPAIGLPGEARLTVYGDSKEVKDATGRILACPSQ